MPNLRGREGAATYNFHQLLSNPGGGGGEALSTSRVDESFLNLSAVFPENFTK